MTKEVFMSGILAVISEYNPFHNGHLKHLNYSKQLTKADFSMAIISGNFVQRGDTSLVDKWTKAEMALKSGFDIVLELPTIYAISSAENFAEGAVKILNSLGIVDYLSFGSELGEIAPLNDLANLLYKEPKELSSLIHHGLKNKAVRIFKKVSWFNVLAYKNQLTLIQKNSPQNRLLC